MRRIEARREFDHFVVEAAGALLRTAYLVVWDQAEAEDLVQEALFRVARRWPRVREMDRPHAYARRILLNLALDDSKRRSRRRAELTRSADELLTTTVDHGAARALGRIEAGPEVARALARLAPRQRAILVLRYFCDLSEAEVAEALDCSIGTVKSTASRALDRLRTEIPDYGRHPMATTEQLPCGKEQTEDEHATRS